MEESEVRTKARAFFFDQFVGFQIEPEPHVQEIYGKALVLCARGDGELHPKELAWIQGYLANTGAPNALIDEVAGYDGPDDIVEVLAGDDRTANLAARNLIFDAFRICESDAELAESERQAIYRIGRKMGLTDGNIAQVEAAYMVYKAALVNKMAVLFPEGNPPY